MDLVSRSLLITLLMKCRRLIMVMNRQVATQEFHKAIMKACKARMIMMQMKSPQQFKQLLRIQNQQNKGKEDQV